MQRGNLFSWICLLIPVLMCRQVPSKKFILRMLIIAMSMLTLIFNSKVSLGELVSISDCTCPGYELKLQCMVTGIGFVEWRGTALYDDCAIRFRLSGFEPGNPAAGTCNDGSIVGHWIERQGQDYTSQLTILVNSTLAGKTVQCVYNNRHSDIIIGEHMITLTADYPFKPPNDVHISDVGFKMLTFNWSQNLDLNCDVIHYNVSATSCGVCPDSTSNTTVTCTDVTLSPNSTMLCSFSIQPIVCGNIGGNESNTAFITLESPGTPSLKSITPHYSSTSKKLIRLGVELSPPLLQDSVAIDTKSTASTTSYTINVYSDSNGTSCASVDIPASSCVGESCISVFNIPNKSCLMNSVQITVTALASGYFGNGLKSVPMFIGIKNTLFDVKFDFKGGIVHCDFSEWYSQENSTNIVKSCSLIYGPMQSFDNCNASLINRNTSIENYTVSIQNSVIIPLSQTSTESDELIYCFIAKGTVMMKTVAIEGTFKWGKRTSSAIDVQRIIIIPTFSCTVVIVTMIAVISGVIVLNRRRKRYQPASSTQQNIYMSCTGLHKELIQKHSIGETIYADIQPSLSELQTVPLDNDAVVYAEVNHQLTLVDKTAANSQQQTCISKQSEDGHNQDHQHANINMKSQAYGNLPNLDNLLAKLHSITHLWYQFGLAVGIAQNILDSYSELPPDKCLIEVLNYWLTNHHSKPTWQDVMKALNEMQLFQSTLLTERQTDTATVSSPTDL